MWKQGTLAFSNIVCVSNYAAKTKKVKVEGSGYREPQP